MANTLKLQLPLLASSQAQKDVTLNQALTQLDALVQLSVISRIVATPPANPSNEDAYIVPAGALGVWAGQTNAVAIFLTSTGGWVFLPAQTGWQAFSQADNAYYVFFGGFWQKLSGRFADIINVKERGAVGDGVTDDTAAIQSAIYAAFGTIANPNGLNYYLNKTLYFPLGNYKITAPLNIPNVQGAVIEGAGRFATTITNNTGTGIFVTNGFEYGQVRGMTLSCTGSTAICFDLNWDGVTGVALQSNTFSDMFFTGGAQGVRIAFGGFMGSENLFLNCFWISHAVAGLSTNCFNALQNTVVGGNFQSCQIGIWVNHGTVCAYSVGFQTSVDYDIRIAGSAHDAYIFAGCRTESPNFITSSNDPAIQVTGCSQLASASGIFLSNGGSFIINACQSVNGQISGNCTGIVTSSTFGREDFWFDLTQVRLALTLIEITTPTKYYLKHYIIGGLGDGRVTPIDLVFTRPVTVAQLNAATPASANLTGARAFVSDATTTLTAGIGTVVVGGGANKVPVVCVGTGGWLIG